MVGLYLEKAEKYFDSLRNIRLLKLRELKLDAVEKKIVWSGNRKSSDFNSVVMKNRRHFEEFRVLAEKILVTYEFYGLFHPCRSRLAAKMGLLFSEWLKLTGETDLPRARM